MNASRKDFKISLVLIELNFPVEYIYNIYIYIYILEPRGMFQNAQQHLVVYFFEWSE